MMDALEPLTSPAHLEAGDFERFSRHIIIPTLGAAGQSRIKSAKVLVIGAGGLGSPAVMYLAAAGVGTIGVVDFDSVDRSNLQRQIIHADGDVGRAKVDSALDSAHRINPDVNVVAHKVRLDSTNALDIFASYDLIVDGTDNFASRYLINDAAVLLGKPVVWASIYRFEGQVSTFWAEHGPCYRCLFPEPPAAGTVPSCAEGGVLGSLCGAIGSMQTTEAIKLITGIGQPLIGRLVIHNALDFTFREIAFKKDPLCPVCGPAPREEILEDYELFCGARPVSVDAPEISVQQLKEMLDSLDPKGQPYILDVREPGEFEIVALPGATLMPQQQILQGHLTPEVPRDQLIVVYCKSGVRSARCQEALLADGFTQVVNLQGGILAWAREIDTSLPVY